MLLCSWECLHCYLAEQLPLSLLRRHEHEDWHTTWNNTHCEKDARRLESTRTHNYTPSSENKGTPRGLCILQYSNRTACLLHLATPTYCLHQLIFIYFNVFEFTTYATWKKDETKFNCKKWDLMFSWRHFKSFLLNVTECYPEDDLIIWRYVKGTAIPVKVYLSPEVSRSCS